MNQPAPSIDELTEALARARLPRRPRARDRAARSRSRSRKPLLLEGEAGVGKTELAKTLADVLGARLIRLQCYEGIDVAHALYDWNYARQMLYIRTLEAGGTRPSAGDVDELFGPALPGAPAAARRDRARRPGAAGAADRRDRPRRRRVRGLPARAALGLPGHDPRDRHDPRARAPAGRDPDLQPHARAARRAQAALPLSLDRPPVARARDRDRARARAGRARAARARGRGLRRTRCARSTWRRRRASPRRSTGRRRCRRSASEELDAEHRSTRRSASVLKYHEDLERVRDARPRRARRRGAPGRTASAVSEPAPATPSCASS